MSQIKREIAYKSTVGEIINGDFVVRDGWEPNFVRDSVHNRDLSRVNIIGTIIEAGGLFRLDDGTGNVILRRFEKPMPDLTVGDLVLVVGRPREYNEERYLMIECLQRLENHAWLLVRRKELASRDKESEAVVSSEKVVEEPTKKNSLSIVEIIEQLDEGNGVTIERVLQQAGKDIDEGHIRRLVEDGEIFEIRPGIVKML